MTTTQVLPDVGATLRRWRDRRRLTQMELGTGAGISTRLLSFVLALALLFPADERTKATFNKGAP